MICADFDVILDDFEPQSYDFKSLNYLKSNILRRSLKSSRRKASPPPKLPRPGPTLAAILSSAATSTLPFCHARSPRIRFIFANRFNRFRPRFRNQNNWAPFIPESLSHLLPEILVIWIGKKFVAIHEQQKRRRRFLHLRRIKELQTMPLRADRLPLFDRIIQSPIQKRRWNLLLQLRRHITHRLQQSFQMKSALRRSKNHRRIIQEKQILLHPRRKLRQRGHFLLSAAGFFSFFPTPLSFSPLFPHLPLSSLL